MAPLAISSKFLTHKSVLVVSWRVLFGYPDSDFGKVCGYPNFEI